MRVSVSVSLCDCRMSDGWWVVGGVPGTSRETDSTEYREAMLEDTSRRELCKVASGTSQCRRSSTVRLMTDGAAVG